MLHRDPLIGDYGPSFLGQAFKVDDGIICVVPKQLNRRPEAQASMRKMLKALGSDCGECRNCPLGKGG
jgi:hypothetical protein